MNRSNTFLAGKSVNYKRADARWSWRAPLALELPVVLALMLALSTVAVGAAEPPKTEPFGSALEVREVLIDVLVTDRQGNPIVGLGPDDFVVEEDGAPVTLTAATFYSTHRQLPAATGAGQSAPPDLAEIPQDRYFILFFHDQRRHASELPALLPQQMAALREAKRWLAAKEPNDWVAVVNYDYKLKVYADFTRDPAALAGALDRAGEGADPGAEWPSRITAGDNPLMSSLPRGKELGKQTENVYDALRLLAEAAGNVAARKNLVYFGFGFGRLNSAGRYEPDSRYYPAMMQALNDNNVAMYTLDILAAKSDHVMTGALTQLAADSGGRSFLNFVSFTTPLTEIAKETNGTYLLAYRSATAAAGERRFQEVTVRVKNPEFRVRARSGYLAGGESSVKPRSTA